jgi:death-on-curing protein
VIAEAAALWESLSQSHPFIDGSKRTAFACTFTFSLINGLRMNAGAARTWGFLNGHYGKGTSSFAVLEKWLRNNTEGVR